MKKGNLVLWLVVAGLLSLAVMGGVSQGVSAKTAPVVGGIAPNFSVNDLNGKSVELTQVLKNKKVTLINFWATWCPPCRAEIPEFVKFYRKYSTKGVEILAINLQENGADVKNFAKNNGMNFPVLLDTSGRVGTMYQVMAIPTTFFVDSNGKIIDRIEGSTSMATLEAKVRSML